MVNTLAAIWLFLSTIAMKHINAGTVWCNVLVSIAVFFLSLVPNRGVPAHT
jgi:hypothetical protein